MVFGKAGKILRIAFFLFCAILALSSMKSADGQGPADAKATSADDIAATRVRITSLRDLFVRSAAQARGKCLIAAPKILIEDVPSFGNYDPDTNTLRISAWSQLKSDEQGVFYRLLGPHATEEQARAEFETGAHHWVAVHELGHWWQACQGIQPSEKHYAMEYGANRIAAAYWMEHDPAIVAHQKMVFAALIQHRPNPLPQGQDAKAYFDANYEKLGPTPAYIWFQARMCLQAFDEKPAPSFAQALKQTSSS